MLAGGRLAAICAGGVWERVLSLIPLVKPCNGSAGVEFKSGCGTVFPNSSLRKTRENVRLASSASVKS